MHHRSRHRKHDRDKEEQRFYLLPGQGGRSHRQKQWFILKWSLFAALVVAAILAAAMYWMNRPKLH
jgi:hypothetical protein